MKKILIIHVAGIGDLVMLLPALKTLRDNFPDSKIDIFIGQPMSASLLTEGELVDKIITFDVSKSSFWQKLSFIHKLRKEKYDFSIITAGKAAGVNAFKGSVFSFLAGAKTRIGEKTEGAVNFYTEAVLIDEKKHIAERNLALLAPLGIKVLTMPFIPAQFTENLVNFADGFLKERKIEGKVLIGIFPSSAEWQKFKRWPLDYFVQLVALLSKEIPNVSFLIFGTEKEADRCQKIKNACPEKSFLALGYSIREVSALIDKCKIFVAGDTGLGHIAATTNTNLISIFGPTPITLARPIGPKVAIVSEKCSYLYDIKNLKNYNLEKEHTCLKKITPERVFEEIKKIMSKT